MNLINLLGATKKMVNSGRDIIKRYVGRTETAYVVMREGEMIYNEFPSSVQESRAILAGIHLVAGDQNASVKIKYKVH